MAASHSAPWPASCSKPSRKGGVRPRPKTQRPRKNSDSRGRQTQLAQRAAHDCAPEAQPEAQPRRGTYAAPTIIANPRPPTHPPPPRRGRKERPSTNRARPGHVVADWQQEAQAQSTLTFSGNRRGATVVSSACPNGSSASPCGTVSAGAPSVAPHPRSRVHGNPRRSAPAGSRIIQAVRRRGAVLVTRAQRQRAVSSAASDSPSADLLQSSQKVTLHNSGPEHT